MERLHDPARVLALSDGVFAIIVTLLVSFVTAVWKVLRRVWTPAGKLGKELTDAKSGVRRILEADLWEISVVTFPMLPGARVERVKALGGLRRPRPDSPNAAWRNASVRGYAAHLESAEFSGGEPLKSTGEPATPQDFRRFTGARPRKPARCASSPTSRAARVG